MATDTAERGDATKPRSGKAAEHAPGGAVHMPTVHLPTVSLPGVRMPAGTAGHLLWWGGLAAAAAFGVVDWPVAALIGAGSWVAERYAKAAQHPTGDQQKAH